MRIFFTKAERLKEIIKHYSDGKNGAFAEMLGVKAQTISTWIARDTYDVDLIFAKCENISAEWLLTGEGEMLKKENPVSDESIAPISTEERLLSIIKEKDSKIEEQAKLIGRLEAENEMLRGKHSDV